MDQKRMDSPDILSAFETSMTEIELLCKKKSASVNQILLFHYLYRTRPEMNYHQEYQRGPIHVGKVEINFRGYVWSDEEIEKYKSLRAREDFKLLGVVDTSVKAAMEALGDELMRYLEEAGEDFEAKNKKNIGKANPEGKKYSSGFKSLLETFGIASAKKEKAKAKKENDWEKQKKVAKASSDIKKRLWGIVHHFKKHHNFLNW
jgi:hypothetical protein